MQIQGQGLLGQSQTQNQTSFINFLATKDTKNLNERQYAFDIDQFRSKDPHAAQDVIKNPARYYKIIKNDLQKGIKVTKGQKQYNNKAGKIEHFDIRFQGNLGANFVTPRGLSSRLANELVGLQGIITKIQMPKHYLQKSVHYCPQTKNIQVKEYPDAFNPEDDEQNLKKTKAILTHDQTRNPLEIQFGLCSFKNSSGAVIQQLPEMAPPGLLPMSVNVILQNSLVGKVKPGDRVQMVGIYKIISGMNTKERGIFKPPLAQTLTMVKQPTKMDFPQQQIFNLFGRSIAPSIWGHQHMKKACLLMLVGGVQKELEGGMRLRGDINLLMIGDPGTAKSQMLRWVLSSVDVSVGTTGSGASGVGLTAAVVTDSITGQKTLQAGAMVLADRGVVCIDQFDKMNQNDRVAVHEVMQQQTVTIAKAGMLFSLNARCSVIAAANPIYGEYQQNMPPTKNIGMPDSLLSRFDLIFIVRDEKNNDTDKLIAEKVCRNHRLAPQNNEFIQQFTEDYDYVVNPVQDIKKQDVTYEKNNVYRGEGKSQILAQSFLKKYINYVKKNCRPQLTDESIQLASHLWAMLRKNDLKQKIESTTKVLPITIRSYQSLIRLSTSHAKLRQSSTVQIKDVFQGFKLMSFCLHGSEDALKEQYNNIMNTLGYENTSEFDSKTKVKIYEQREVTNNKRSKKMQQQINEGISKLQIGKQSKQVDKLLQEQVQGGKVVKIQTTKNQRSFVYKRISDQIKRKRGQQSMGVQQLIGLLKDKLSQDKILAILKELEDSQKITTDKGRIYVV